MEFECARRSRAVGVHTIVLQGPLTDENGQICINIDKLST